MVGLFYWGDENLYVTKCDKCGTEIPDNKCYSITVMAPIAWGATDIYSKKKDYCKECFLPFYCALCDAGLYESEPNSEADTATDQLQEPVDKEKDKSEIEELNRLWNLGEQPA